MQEYTDLLLCFHEVFEAYATVSSEEGRIQNEAHDIDTKVSMRANSKFDCNIRCVP